MEGGSRGGDRSWESGGRVSPPVGSRRKAPVGGLGTKSP